MAGRYELEITITSARDLKNVNWKYGDLRPYAVVWVDPAKKCSTKVDVENDVNPVWDEKLKIPLPYDKSINECTVHIDVVHAKSDGQDDTKPLIGSTKLPLAEVVDEVGIGGKFSRSLKLKRPSGRPQGKLEVKVAIKEIERYNTYDPYAPPYGQPAPGGATTRDYPAPPPPYGSNYPPYGQSQYGYSQPYGAAPPPAGYPYTAHPSGYGAPPSGYGAPPPQSYGAPPPPMYGQGSYNEGYGQGSYGQSYSSNPAPVVVGEKKKSKFGMGTGLAVGAAAGVLGGLALAEGVDYIEDKIEDDVAERVEDDLAYDDGGFDDY